MLSQKWSLFANQVTYNYTQKSLLKVTCDYATYYIIVEMKHWIHLYYLQSMTYSLGHITV